MKRFEDEFPEAGACLAEIYASGYKPFQDREQNYYFPSWFRCVKFTDQALLACAIFQAYIERKFFGVGRNDLCPCGSGKKFKRCCL